MKTHAPLKFIETKDPALLQQYFELRRRAYLAEYPWLSTDFGAEDEHDHVSRTVIAIRGGIVAGGARLTMTKPGNRRLLPLEKAGLRLGDYEPLANLHLAFTSYGEISRVAVDPALAQDRKASFLLGDKLCDLAANEGADVVFSICPRRPADLNERHARRRGAEFRRFGEISTIFSRPMWLCAFTGLLRVYGKEDRNSLCSGAGSHCSSPCSASSVLPGV